MRKIKHVCLFGLLLLAAAFSIAQDAEFEKLKQLKDDTAKVNKLAVYGKTFLDNDNAKAVQVYEACVELSRKLRYENGIDLSYRRLG